MRGPKTLLGGMVPLALLLTSCSGGTGDAGAGQTGVDSTAYEAGEADDSVGTYTLLALNFLEDGHYDLAARQAREAIRVGPEDPRGHDLLARASLALGDTTEALLSAREAARLQPAVAAYRRTLEQIEGGSAADSAPTAADSVQP